MCRKHRRRCQSRFVRVAHLARSIAPRTAAGVLVTLAALLAASIPTQAEANAQLEPCPAEAPVPTAVAVTAVPIVVESTTADYFVLYVSHDVDADTTVDIPVLVKRGEAGTTTLAENVEALPMERYRVEKYLIADPADIDGDCIDDITELGDPVGMNPVNPAPAIALNDGAVIISDRDTFEALAVSSRLKFIAFDVETDRPVLYFVNTKTHDNHNSFLDAVGLDFDLDAYRGEIAYDPTQVASDSSLGVYYYHSTQTNTFPFNVETRLYTMLAASLPLIEKNLSLYIPNQKLPTTRHVVPLLRESRIPLLFTEHVIPGGNFLALNPGEGYGRLQVLDPDDRPHSRDVVIYEALPNELPRVAGTISTVPQTPLSHVNLRAVQNGIPNAYIRDILDDPDTAPLIGSYVRYEVTEDGHSIRAATKAEVDDHYESSRPAGPQTPEFNLSVTGIKPLSQIGFEDWTAFGVKAANVAVLGTLGFPEGTVPDGFAIPFYFYDEFMKAHDFYTRIETMLADPDFQTDFDVQDDMLDDLRDDIEDADSPQWIVDDLTTMHATYPEGQSLRYRSSTNNEDLPGFNGAGLYDSKTQNPDETVEDGIDKSLKGVFASLWTVRAFTERDFHRIDHMAAKMGVLVHPNYSDELANGVAVSFDPTSGKYDRYYINTQLGEDLVTNPETHSTPEELLLRKSGSLYSVLATSNLLDSGELLMSYTQMRQLRDYLTVIHDHFAGLYNPGPGEPFAMEIEFKITSEDILAIKQARPWVFGGDEDVTPPPPPPPPPPPLPPPPPPITGGGGGGGGGGGRARPPSYPGTIQAEGGDGEVTLRWDAPSSQGSSRIQHYEYRIDGEGEWISTGSTDRIHTIGGLINGRTYFFHLRAVSAAGAGSHRISPEVTPVADLDFTHFANGGFITSTLALVNAGAYPVRPAIYFYDQDGDPIAARSLVALTPDLEILDDGALRPRTVMNPLEELTIATHGRGGLRVGSVTVRAASSIGGVLRFDIPGLGVAGVGDSPTLRDALVPVRRQDGGINTGVAVRNRGTATLTLECRLMRDGAVVEEADIRLEVNGQDSRFIDQVFPTADTSDFSGSVRCAAPEPGRFSAVAFELDGVNRIFTTLPVVPVPAPPASEREQAQEEEQEPGGEPEPTRLDFTHFANGGKIVSSLVLVNAGADPVRPAIYFNDQDGGPVAAESMVDVPADMEIDDDGALRPGTAMNPLGELTISTHGRGGQVVGSVAVAAEGPIGGVLRFDIPRLGVAGVGDSPPVRDALVPVRRQADGINTGVAVHNRGTAALLVRCRLMQAGAVLEETMIPLAANGQDSRFIDQVFPTADTSDFVGSVRCLTPEPGLFSAVAFELDGVNRIFTTLPVVPVVEVP